MNTQNRTSLGGLARFLGYVSFAAAASCGNDDGSGQEPAPDMGMATPIEAPDPRPGEDKVTSPPRDLDPASLGDFYLETNAVDNREGNAYGLAILLQTSASEPDQILSLNDMPGYTSLADYAAGQPGIVLMGYQAFADFLFGAAGQSPQVLADPDYSPGASGPNNGKTFLGVVQEAYRQTGIEALNQLNTDQGAIGAAVQLEAILQGLIQNDTGRGITLDRSNPVIAGRTANGTPFIAYPILSDGSNPMLMLACGDCRPLSTPQPGARYGNSYSPLTPERMDNVVRAAVELTAQGFDGF